jgi:pyridoxal phosphate enzyme (YggS family)
MSIDENFRTVKASIAAAEQRYGRATGSVGLVAVTKFKPVENVRAALETGHRVFGENRVQEAAEKYSGLRQDFPDLELHLVGPLQSNKLRDAIQVFDVIQTLDRPKLAEALARVCAMPESRVRQLYIQVNTGEEPQKAGIGPRDADAFIKDCIERLSLPVVGLMCIPPAGDEPALHFALLREMAKRHGLSCLSMGMSEDYPVAIQQGATHVRLGTALFGARDAAP